MFWTSSFPLSPPMGFDALSHLRTELPLHFQQLTLPTPHTLGLVLIDVVNGFCSVGSGSLAPTKPDVQISRMVHESAKVAKEFSSRGWPILVFLDTHDANKPEPPYPPHCIKGSGEEELVPALQWLENDKHAKLMRKDCINGFVGAMQKDGSNEFVDWVHNNSIEMILVSGICTDICVLDFVVTVLSARNHGLLFALQDVLVFSEGCATYDLSRELANNIEGTLSHPQGLTHYMGLYMARSRGAQLVDRIVFSDSKEGTDDSCD